MKLTQRHKYLIALALIALMGISTFYIYRLARHYFRGPQKQEQWMTIFVHGSFGSMFGLFSAYHVFQDEVDGTTYKKMTSHMRYDPFFHHFQALLAPGLTAITPTFDPPETVVKPAVYPIAASYEKLTDLAAPSKEQQHFYVFGWSGLISQQRRRKEALRFYNMLHREYTRLQENGITPKIRLVTHSHGGNLILNMAGIHELLSHEMTEPTADRYPDDDYRTSMSALYEMMNHAPEAESIAERPHQKSWDYKPSKAPFAIDEFILLGTPIQPETSSFFLSPFFKKIYSFYSENDVVQSSDGVSTRRYYSDQRIPCMPVAQENRCKITQIKLSLNKPNEDSIKEPEVAEPREVPQDWQGRLAETATTLWHSLFAPRQTTQLPDPDHKEFWFMGWKQREGTTKAQQFIRPLPYVVFVPLIQSLLENVGALTDIDLRLKFKKNAVDFIVYQHKSLKKEHKFSLPLSVLQFLQEQTLRWEPENVDPNYEMNILHRYSKMLSL